MMWWTCRAPVCSRHTINESRCHFSPDKPCTSATSYTIVTFSVTGYHKYHTQLNLTRQGRCNIVPIWLPEAWHPRRAGKLSSRRGKPQKTSVAVGEAWPLSWNGNETEVLFRVQSIQVLLSLPFHNTAQYLQLQAGFREQCSNSKDRLHQFLNYPKPCKCPRKSRTR